MSRVLLLTILSCFFLKVHGQNITPSIINSAGASGTVAGVTFEYSVGEPIATTVTKTNVEVTQGFLQPMIVTTAVSEQISDEALEIFPNPFSDHIFLQPNTVKNTVISYSLTDASGKVLANKQVLLGNGNELQLFNIADYAAGNYFLTVNLYHNDKIQSRTWKLIKSK